MSAPRFPGPRDVVRVASVPASHPYVRGLGLEGAGARILADPPVPGAPAGRWWPPVMLDPVWIARHRESFDVMHLHFGFESLSVDELDRALAALRAARRPLVYTVHDLSHPQLDDQSHHLGQLERVFDHADGLITLTAGAAAEIETRWGRRALVLGHPALFAPEDAAPAVSPPAAPVVGLALRDLRPSIDGPGAVAALIAATGRLRRAGTVLRVRVTMHEHVRDPAARAEVRRLCATGGERIELIEAPRPDDHRLARELAELAVAVLPYRHGTHSGWLELCWDLGVPVAGPKLGYFGDQHPDDAFFAPFTAGDAGALAGALTALLVRPEAIAGSPARARARASRRAARRYQRAETAAAHLRLYRRLIDDARGQPAARSRG